MIDDSLCALQAHEQDCFAIAIVAERWLASGGEDDVAFLWDQHVSGKFVTHCLLYTYFYLSRVLLGVLVSLVALY